MTCAWCGQPAPDDFSYMAKMAGEPDAFRLCERCMGAAGATCESCLALLGDNWTGGQCPDCGEIVGEDGALEVVPLAADREEEG